MRQRKLKNIDERFEMFSEAIVSEPDEMKGKWRTWHSDETLKSPQSWREVRLDLGCGKGDSTVQAALEHPDVLFVGIDCIDTCIVLCAQKAIEAKASNVAFIHADANDILEFFDRGEISKIYLNFSSPFPKRKHAEKRLTHFQYLAKYREILSEDGMICFKTDSPPLFEFSKIQFDIAGYETVWSTEDLRADRPEQILTGYESRLIAKGAKIFALDAVPGPAPDSMVQTAPLGLIEYLPEDLDELEYVPYGMEDTVFNMKNRRANAKRRAEKEN